MARIEESELKKQIKNGDFANAYFIYGDENYLKEHYIKKMKTKLVDKTFESFNYHDFDSNSAPIEEIIRTAEMLPIMSEFSFITVHDYPFDKSESECKEICGFLSDLPDTVVLVFWYEAVIPDLKRNRKWKSVEAAFSKFGASVALNKKSEGEIAKLLCAGAKKRNKALSTDNAKYLISVSGSSLRVLLNELEKLCSYSKENEITKRDIDSVAVKCLDARVYDLSKAIVRGDYDTAHFVLDTLFSMREEPITVLSVISGSFIDMYRAKCAKINGFSDSDIVKSFNYKGREFAVRNAMRDCSRISIEALRKSLDIVLQADISLKSTSADPKLVLEETIVKLLLASKEVQY